MIYAMLFILFGAMLAWPLIAVAVTFATHRLAKEEMGRMSAQLDRLEQELGKVKKDV